MQIGCLWVLLLLPWMRCWVSFEIPRNSLDCSHLLGRRYKLRGRSMEGMRKRSLVSFLLGVWEHFARRRRYNVLAFLVLRFSGCWGRLVPVGVLFMWKGDRGMMRRIRRRYHLRMCQMFFRFLGWTILSWFLRGLGRGVIRFKRPIYVFRRLLLILWRGFPLCFPRCLRWSLSKISSFLSSSLGGCRGLRMVVFRSVLWVRLLHYLRRLCFILLIQGLGLRIGQKGHRLRVLRALFWYCLGHILKGLRAYCRGVGVFLLGGRLGYPSPRLELLSIIAFSLLRDVRVRWWWYCLYRRRLAVQIRTLWLMILCLRFALIRASCCWKGMGSGSLYRGFLYSYYCVRLGDHKYIRRPLGLWFLCLSSLVRGTQSLVWWKRFNISLCRRLSLARMVRRLMKNTLFVIFSGMFWVSLQLSRMLWGRRRVIFLALLLLGLSKLYFGRWICWLFPFMSLWFGPLGLLWAFL